jgi:tetratricopeptide (TPR) repeat protein
MLRAPLDPRLALVIAFAATGCDAPARPSTGAHAASPSASVATSGTLDQVPITSKSKEAVGIFAKGRELQLNTREAEAIAAFTTALALDPDFTQAHAYRGYLTPGEAGTQELEAAAKKTAGLPEAERLVIEELVAMRAGDRAKSRELSERVVKLAPFDWQAQLDYGNRLSDEHKLDEAARAFGKAAAFSAHPPVVYNALGYVYHAQHKYDAAVGAFRRYAALKPDEPNALDSLGEALMNAGKLNEAEASFMKAAQMSFSFAYDGVAQTRFLRGDFNGGMEALAQSRDAALRTVDKLAADANAIWATLSRADTAGAMVRIDAYEKLAKVEKADEEYAMACLYRAVALSDSSGDADALKEIAHVQERVEKAKLPGIAANRVRRAALVWRAVYEAKTEDAAAAQKTAAALEEEAKKAPTEQEVQSMAAIGRGAALLAKGDGRAAVEAFATCLDEDYICRWQLYAAEEKIGDKTAMEVTREKLLNANLRETQYLYVRSKAAPPLP